MGEFHTVVRQSYHSNVTPSAGNTFIPPTMPRVDSEPGTHQQAGKGSCLYRAQLGGQEHPVGIYGVPSVLGTEGSYLREEETDLRRSEGAPTSWGHGWL